MNWLTVSGDEKLRGNNRTMVIVQSNVYKNTIIP